MTSLRSPVRRQSNAPALEALLKQPVARDDMYSKGLSQNKAVEFATPKARGKSRPRIIVEKLEDSNKQRSPKQEFKSKADDFATPRLCKNRPKIIHKEKLDQPVSDKPRNKGLLSKTMSAGSLPTAHVQPSHISTSALTPTSTYSELSSHPCWDDTTMATSPTMMTEGLSNTTFNDTTINSYRNTERFIDRNIGFKDEEFRELISDPDPTLLDNHPPGGLYRNGVKDRFSLQERADVTLHQRKLSDSNNDNLGDMTRSVSALSLDAPTVTNLSDPGMSSMYGSTGAIYNSHSTNHHNVYGRTAPHLPSYNSFDRLPTSFQAASFSSNNIGGGTSYHSSAAGLYNNNNHHHHRLHHGNSFGGDTHFSSDLSLWQQQHQEQLHRQQVEAQQSGLSGQPGPSYTNPGVMSGDPHRMDAIKRAADNIIKEKDNIIDRQKIKILELERHTKESEMELHKSLLQKLQEEKNNYSFKLQSLKNPLLLTEEAQYEAATLKAQLSEVMSGRTGDLENLEKKLAATEYELSELKASLDKEIAGKRRDIKDLEAKVGDKDTLVQDYKEKYNHIRKVNEELQSKMSSLERYLSDLPTMDEHSKKHSEIQLLKEDKSKYKQRCLELEKKLKEMRKGVSSRDGLIESLEQREKDLQDQIQQVQSHREVLSSEVQSLRSEGATIPEEDFKDLRGENERLRADCDRAKKMLDSRHKKIQQLESHHKQEITQLEERLYQDENSVTALREDMANKEMHLKKLRASVKELGSQNQDLMEQNMMLQDKVKEFEKQHTGEAEKLEKRLMKEMAVCFSELQSLVQVCVQHADGQDPNISILLGVKTNAMCDMDLTQQSGDGLQSLKYKVAKIKELREEVDKLRELVSNKFAEDMGENLNCTTQ